MDFETYMRERVRPAAYGTAPWGWIAAHQEVVRQMEQLYQEGMQLTSDKMLELAKRADELSDKIEEFNNQKG